MPNPGEVNDLGIFLVRGAAACAMWWPRGAWRWRPEADDTQLLTLTLLLACLPVCALLLFPTSAASPWGVGEVGNALGSACCAFLQAGRPAAAPKGAYQAALGGCGGGGDGGGLVVVLAGGQAQLGSSLHPGSPGVSAGWSLSVLGSARSSVRVAGVVSVMVAQMVTWFFSL
jgi:hypothetical protein